MTVADVVAQVRDGRLEDFAREAVALIARALMEAEVSAEIGAELGRSHRDDRSTHRNGYRARPWETRVGEVELNDPKKRSGKAVSPELPRAASAVRAATVAVALEAMSTGSRPARSTGWSSSWGSTG